MQPIKTLNTTCVIAGGGPAGMMMGLLLARAGVQTIVLEKHEDFLRDFRGDTIHPSTLELMHELGLLEDFLKCPHQRAHQITGYVEDQKLTIADFSKLSVKCPFIALMPQWDFLNFLASHAKAYPQFRLMMRAKATGLIEENGIVTGVVVEKPERELRIKADLVVGADGRGSTIRECAGLAVRDIGAPIDVLWFKMPRKPTDPDETFGKFTAGKIVVMLERGNYWQCAYVISKGGQDQIQKAGLEAFQQDVKSSIPFFDDRVTTLQSWDQVKLLTVKIDRLETWYKKGLLCIGDAAHAMSPLGGVGINLAVQDAVAAANILAGPLKQNILSIEHLHAVQKRRELAARVIQKIQTMMQDRVISSILKKRNKLQIPWIVRRLQRLPFTRRMVGYIIGIGVRPEHIRV